MSPQRRRQLTFFLIIGIALLAILLGFLYSRLVAPVQSAKAAATATSVSFYATVEAATGPDAIEVNGIPYVSMQPYTWDGLRIDIERVDYDAWPLVHLANQFNKEPPPGRRMIMITLRITSLVAEERLFISGSRFRLVGEKQEPYTTFDDRSYCGVIPEPLEGEIAPGESLRGNICFVAPADEKRFLLEYDSHRYDKGPVYFMLPGGSSASSQEGM
ncbi:MAG: DUF4352 domain-containing protein [Caldilineae bacterium]|nr:MAG: DUF4352 domain-containing protein [Caldilineae bacterium]